MIRAVTGLDALQHDLTHSQKMLSFAATVGDGG